MGDKSGGGNQYTTYNTEYERDESKCAITQYDYMRSGATICFVPIYGIMNSPLVCRSNSVEERVCLHASRYAP